MDEKNKLKPVVTGGRKGNEKCRHSSAGESGRGTTSNDTQTSSEWKRIKNALNRPSLGGMSIKFDLFSRPNRSPAAY